MAVFLFSQNEAFAAAPAYRASGTFTAGTGAITVPYPASMLANDVCLLAVESENQAIALTTANGFVQVPTSPQSAGTAAVNPASRLALFWKRTVGGDAAPVVTDSGDHTTGRIHCFSGVITSGNPWDAGAGGNDGAVNDTTGTIPGATTTSADTLVVLITSNSRNGTSTANCSAWTNASLTGLTERSDNTNTAGLGGGHCMATGIKAAAGLYGTTTVTLATTSFKGAISLALKPATAGPTATTDPASGITTPNNGASWFATLNGVVSSNGADTTVTFEYGLTAAYGTSVTATQSPLAAVAVDTAVSADLIGLACNTTFNYRVVATNGAGTSYGSNSTFTTGACAGQFAATDCAAARFGANLVCTANDVNLTGIVLAPTEPVQQSSCVSGTPVTLDIDMTVNFATPDRWDVGIFIAKDGKLPTLLPANGGASSCTVDILPITSETGSYTFPDLDGAPQGTLDTCGDGNSAINGGTGSGIKRMTSVTLPCYATPASGGKLFVPFVVSWDNQKSPIGGLCTSNLDPVPNTTSKCNAPLNSVAIEVVVLPKIIKTHSGATFNNGNTITYTITVFNDSGGALQDSFFKDPIVANLAVTGLSCAAANGATCPITNNTMADMQGPTGIPIPSANLPNNSSLIFTVTGTLSGSIGTTIDNTATVSIVLNTNSSTDSVTLGSASASKSFSPAAITEDNNSLMTITFTNPTAFDVTGVSFIDTYPSGLVNAASPNVSTTCGGTVTAIAGGLTFSGGTIPASGSCTVSVYVTSATANNYINSVSFLPGSLGSASATLTVNAITVGAFDAGEIGTWDRNFPDAPVIPHIYTKLAGTGFSLELAVLKSDGTRLTSYSKTVLVELLDSSVNSVFDPTTNCDSGWVSLAPPVSFSADFAPSNPNKGVTLPVAFPSVPKAYSDVRVRVTEGTKIGCSTDRFAIRPSAVTLMTNASAAAPSASATPIFGAGTPFTLYATTTTGTNYNGALTLDTLDTGKLTAQITSQDTTQQGGGTVGTLTPATLTANPSPLPSNNVSYSEVGYLYLGAGAFRDDTYTNVDKTHAIHDCISDTNQDVNADSIPDYLSDVLINGKYGCSVGNKTPVSLGRFVPDHFDTVVELTANLPMPCPTGLIPGCPTSYDGFVYSGQPFSVKVTAKNAGGNTTQNYQGVFAKAVTLAAWDALGSTTTQNPSGLLTNNSIAAALFGAMTPGVATTSTPVYTLAAATTAPTDIYIRAVDADGVSSLRSPATNSVEGGVKVVSGRVKIANAYGSELLPLPMTAMVQYYNGTNWLTSLTDSVTSLTLGLSNYQCKTGCPWTTTPAPASGQVIAGILLFKLSKPTSGGTGSVDVSISVPDYLLTGSNGAGVDPSRPGRATFGVYKGNNQFIYLREMY